ncbi:MAG TPA: proton-conducting transporter membrane subunit [Solirubrobacteraceae bacterium]
MTSLLLIAVPGAPVLGALLVRLPRTPRGADRVNLIGASISAAVALMACVVELVHGARGLHGSWFVLDYAGASFLAVIAVVGWCSAISSPTYLAGAGKSLFTARRARAWYYSAFHLFWAALLALALVKNLGVAWLLIEATTGASALLVAYSGRRNALEAGWKYLVLTTFGLAVALLGILILFVGLAPHGGTLGTLDWQNIARHAHGLPHRTALFALILILVGLAAKIGWAPVHNWLPDAHSEAPPPVSALLSAALLPTVMLIAWRVVLTLGLAVPHHLADHLMLAFGLASLAVAVPFLWRPMAWKRLLAYSSLEHMGILALGIGFASPLATVGVVVHLAGHALAKSLGFYAAIPLLRHDPDSAHRAPRGLARLSPPVAAAVGVSLATLSGLPPSPLFFSELLILLGGIAAHQVVIVSIAAVLMGLGFLGLAHALIETLAGESRGRRWLSGRTVRLTARLTVALTLGLLALSAGAYLLAESHAGTSLMSGVA